jgi:hypothetical protein
MTLTPSPEFTSCGPLPRRKRRYLPKTSVYSPTPKTSSSFPLHTPLNIPLPYPDSEGYDTQEDDDSLYRQSPCSTCGNADPHVFTFYLDCPLGQIISELTPTSPTLSVDIAMQASHEDQELDPSTLGRVSPRSVRTILATNPDLDTCVIRQIADGLIQTLCSRQDTWNNEKQELEARNRSLEEHVLLHEETLATPPEGYVINGNRVQVGIPISEGLTIQPHFVKQLPDSHIACLTPREGVEDMPYIIELYAPRHRSVRDVIFPMPNWLDCSLQGNSDLFQVVSAQVEGLDDWGLTREIHRYRDLDTRIYEVHRKMEELETSLTLLKGQQVHCRHRLDKAHIVDRLPNLEMLACNSESINKQYGRRTAPLPHRATWVD